MSLQPLITNTVIKISSQQRASLHLAAVMASNFSNHLLSITQTFCEEKNVPFNLLQILMRESIDKAFDVGPIAAQTGPAKRGDYNTLKNHIAQLPDNELKEIYKILTNNILSTYGKAKL